MAHRVRAALRPASCFASVERLLEMSAPLWPAADWASRPSPNCSTGAPVLVSWPVYKAPENVRNIDRTYISVIAMLYQAHALAEGAQRPVSARHQKPLPPLSPSHPMPCSMSKQFLVIFLDIIILTEHWVPVATDEHMHHCIGVGEGHGISITYSAHGDVLTSCRWRRRG